MLLTELLTPDRIRLPIEARNKDGVLRELTRLLAQTAGGDEADVYQAVREREGVLSTGIGFGVAIPHGRAASVRQLSMVAGVTPVPVPFDGLDGEGVRLFFVIVGPVGAAGQHVQVLARIARLVRSESVRGLLLAAETPQRFCDVLAEAETR